MYPFHHCTISSFLFHCNYSNCHRQSFQFSFNDKQKQWKDQLIYVYSAIQKIVNYQLIYKSPFFNYVAREVCTFALYLDISTAMESEKNDWIKSITFWSPLSLQIRPDNKLIRQRSIDLMWCLLVTWDAIYVKLHEEISLKFELNCTISRYEWLEAKCDELSTDELLNQGFSKLKIFTWYMQYGE